MPGRRLGASNMSAEFWDGTAHALELNRAKSERTTAQFAARSRPLAAGCRIIGNSFVLTGSHEHGSAMRKLRIQAEFAQVSVRKTVAARIEPFFIGPLVGVGCRLMDRRTEFGHTGGHTGADANVCL